MKNSQNGDSKIEHRKKIGIDKIIKQNEQINKNLNCQR